MRDLQVMAWAALAAVATASLPGCDTQSTIGENPQLTEPVGNDSWQPAGTSTNRIQFAVDGVPVGAGEVVEVAPSDVLTVGIYVVPDQPIVSFTVELVFNGPWPEPPLPEIYRPPADVLILSGDVRMIGDWANVHAAAFYNSPYNVYFIGSFLSWLAGREPQSEPGVTAEFDLHVPDVPISTELACEFTFGEVSWRGPEPNFDDSPDLLPLVLHVTPEPMSLPLRGISPDRLAP